MFTAFGIVAPGVSVVNQRVEIGVGDGKYMPTPSAVASTPITVGSVKSAGGITVSWTGGNAPFKVQKRSALGTGTWSDVSTTSNRSVELPVDGEAGFYRVIGQ